MPKAREVLVTPEQERELIWTRDHHQKAYVRTKAAAMLKVAAGQAMRQVAAMACSSPSRKRGSKQADLYPTSKPWNTSPQTEQMEQVEQTEQSSHASPPGSSIFAPSGTVVTLEASLFQGHTPPAGWPLCSRWEHRTHHHTGDTRRSNQTASKKKKKIPRKMSGK